MASRQRLFASTSSGDGLGMEVSPSDCRNVGSSSGCSSLPALRIRASWKRSNAAVSMPLSRRCCRSFFTISSYSFVPGLGRSSFFSQSGSWNFTLMFGLLVQYQSFWTVSTATQPPGSFCSPDGGVKGELGSVSAASNGSRGHSYIGSCSGASGLPFGSTHASRSRGSVSSSSPSNPSKRSVSVKNSSPVISSSSGSSPTSSPPSSSISISSGSSGSSSSRSPPASSHESSSSSSSAGSRKSEGPVTSTVPTSGMSIVPGSCAVSGS